LRLNRVLPLRWMQAVMPSRLCTSADRARVQEAEKAGVKSVPALVIEGGVFHINFGAGLEALK